MKKFINSYDVHEDISTSLLNILLLLRSVARGLNRCVWMTEIADRLSAVESSSSRFALIRQFFAHLGLNLLLMFIVGSVIDESLCYSKFVSKSNLVSLDCRPGSRALDRLLSPVLFSLQSWAVYLSLELGSQRQLQIASSSGQVGRLVGLVAPDSKLLIYWRRPSDMKRQTASLICKIVTW